MESNADRADNVEEGKVEVNVSAVYKDLETLAETHSGSEVEDAGVKSKLRVADRMDALLTAIIL